MPRTCSICAHSARADVDAALIAGTPLRDIACQFGVGRMAVQRHAAEHLLAKLVKAKQAEEVSRASDLLAMAMERDAKALALLAKAEAADDLKSAGQMLRISFVSLELLARLRGLLAEQTTTVNVLVLPEYLAARSAVVGALAAFPEARHAVVEALAALQEGGGNTHGNGQRGE